MVQLQEPTSPMAGASGPTAQPTRTTTQPQDGGIGTVCFCKMFYQVFKVKQFTTFYKRFYSQQQKTFFRFDQILMKLT